MKVNFSIITDVPLFAKPDILFQKAKKAGVDGLELVLGVKTRLEYARMGYLSEKYNLPIVSIHQPPWSGIGIYFDEHFVQLAKKLGVRSITYHPLAFHSFDSKKGKLYLEKLARLQEKYNISVMLENMGSEFIYRKLHDSSSEHVLHHLEDLNRIADTYGFLITYDVSHAEITNPGETKIFQQLFPKIGNIHASSFTLSQQHLPLTEGQLNAESFVRFLAKKKYAGLFTLEVRPALKQMLRESYDFFAIAKSVALVKKVTHKEL